jgi:2-methylcitrate dehydratase PrpD
MSEGGFTRVVAERSAGLQFDDLPDDVVEVARQCVLDWLAVTVAGSREPCARLLLDEYRDMGLGDDGVTVVGRDARLPLVDAAIVNGTASHALDYDDVNEAMLGHPSVPILAGLMALAEHLDVTGSDLLTAFVAGYETECRIGRAVGRVHYQRGFHGTGTVGTFGAAAACARLLSLDPPTTAIALGIAGAQAAGLKAMFGTMCKPLHAGKASANGLLAARLAARGFDSVGDVVECVQGFAETQSDGFDGERGLREPPREWYLRDNLFKYHAACFQTHSSIEGLRRLREEQGFVVDDVDEVVVEADAAQLRMCAIPEPVTGLEAKFSLRHTAAMVLAGEDTSAIGSFADELVRQPSVVQLRGRVVVQTGRTPGGPTPVSVHLRDGRVLRAAHDMNVPETDLALQGSRLEAKFRSLVAPVLGAAVASELAATAREIDELADIGSLLALTVSGEA